MKSYRSRNFDKLFAQLPAHIQELARKNYRLWCDNPRHPSLDFREKIPGRWTVRIGSDYRAFAAKFPDGSYLWTWIGPHQVYDKLLRERR